MKMISEGKLEAKQHAGEVQIEKVDGEYLVTMRTQYGQNKLHEHTVKFNQNGINALLGSWMAVTGNDFD